MKIAYTLLARNDLAKIYRWYQSHGGVELADVFTKPKRPEEMSRIRTAGLPGERTVIY